MSYQADIFWISVKEKFDLKRFEFLSNMERERFNNIQNEDRAKQFAASRALLREKLSEVTGGSQEPGSFLIEESTHGKPYIQGGPYFSISHTQDWSVVALSYDDEIGIDIEKRKPTDRPFEELLLRVLPKGVDVKKLFSSARDEVSRQKLFFRIWTAHEALVKLKGDTVLKAQLSPTLLEQIASRQGPWEGDGISFVPLADRPDSALYGVLAQSFD